jgi:hypothetical protein
MPHGSHNLQTELREEVMKSEITITVESDDPYAPIKDLIDALNTLLCWQWDNVSIQSRTTGTGEDGS